MSAPIEMDIPHQLGKAGVRARLDSGIGKIGTMIPGGAQVRHDWTGDTMRFVVSAMGQEIAATAEVFEDKVHAIVHLPGLLGMLAGPIKAAIQAEGPKLLK